MVEDNGHTKIVEPVQDEGLRIREPPAKREEPMRTHFKEALRRSLNS
jgi:hypothetical protein